MTVSSIFDGDDLWAGKKAFGFQRVKKRGGILADIIGVQSCRPEIALALFPEKQPGEPRLPATDLNLILAIDQRSTI